MTTKKKAATGRGAVTKLKLTKETIRDLEASNKGRHVKGGLAVLPPITQTEATCDPLRIIAWPP